MKHRGRYDNAASVWAPIRLRSSGGNGLRSTEIEKTENGRVVTLETLLERTQVRHTHVFYVVLLLSIIRVIQCVPTGVARL